MPNTRRRLLRPPGKFWEMHDVLFENQRALDDENLTRYAAGLGLNSLRFADELARHTHAARAREDREDFLSGARGGVNGTPTLFINGVRHDGSFDLDTLLGAIEAATVHRYGGFSPRPADLRVRQARRGDVRSAYGRVAGLTEGKTRTTYEGGER